MSMNTFTVDQLRGDILAQAMKTLHADPRKLPEGYYSARVEPELGMLVEPVNGHAFVFFPPKTICQFESEAGSGTDKIRQRMLAGLFFDQTVANHHAGIVREAAGADRVAAVIAENTAAAVYEPAKGDKLEITFRAEGVESKREVVVSSVKGDGSFFVNATSGPGFGASYSKASLLNSDLFTFKLLDRPTLSRRSKP